MRNYFDFALHFLVPNNTKLINNGTQLAFFSTKTDSDMDNLICLKPLIVFNSPTIS